MTPTVLSAGKTFAIDLLTSIYLTNSPSIHTLSKPYNAHSTRTVPALRAQLVFVKAEVQLGIVTGEGTNDIPYS